MILENTLDFTHTTYLHKHFNYKNPDKMAAQETPYGLRVYAPGLSGVDACYEGGHFQMPNVQEYMSSPKPGEKTGYYARAWRVPVDDETSLRFEIRVYPLRGKEAEESKERQTALASGGRMSDEIPRTVHAILRGEEHLPSPKHPSRFKGSELISVQDAAVLASLGPMDRDMNDLLGQMDVGVALTRRIWIRELAAFAAGAPPRRWTRPRELWRDAKRF
jgi:5,5'-dehydrodivanillate O-demethylase